MKIAFDKLYQKFTQESTWRGLIALAMACGSTVDPARQNAIVAGGLTLIGLINVIKKD